MLPCPHKGETVSQYFMQLIIFLCLTVSLNGTAYANAVSIISAEELNNNRAKYIVIDAREEGYESFHIPESFSMDWREFTLAKPHLLNKLAGDSSDWGKVIEDKERIERTLRAMGISNDSKVVVVGESNLWGTEGRIAWNLLYWGLDQVYLLNGGIDTWKKQKYTLEKGPGKPHKTLGKFKIKLQAARRSNKDEIKNSLNKALFTLIDARSMAEFEGEKLFGQKRGGHIPGAKLISFESLYDRNGNYISKELFLKQVQPSHITSISYCLGGVRSALYAVLYEAYTGTIVKNYDGSFWEWSADTDLPVEK